MEYKPYEYANFYQKTVMYFKKSRFEYSFKNNFLICIEYKMVHDVKYIIKKEESNMSSYYA